jgi:hypothetical protein
MARKIGALHTEYCKPPTGEAKQMHMDLFSLCGFPGAVASTDCVHVRWWTCPAGWRAACEGKEGFPTLGYNVSATHDKYIIHAPPGMPGSNNDKTNVLYDKFVQSLRHDEEYTKTKFKVYTTEDGDYEWLEGCYTLMDGAFDTPSCALNANSFLWCIRWVS